MVEIGGEHDSLSRLTASFREDGPLHQDVPGRQCGEARDQFAKSLPAAANERIETESPSVSVVIIFHIAFSKLRIPSYNSYA